MGNFLSRKSNEVSSVSNAVNNGDSSYSSTYTNVNGDERFHSMTGKGASFSNLFATGLPVVALSIICVLILTFWARHRYTSKSKSQERRSDIAEAKERLELSDFSWDNDDLTKVIEINAPY